MTLNAASAGTAGKDKKIVAQLLDMVSRDEILSRPVYMSHIRSETDCNKLGLTPLVFVWNENRSEGTFSVSINAKAVGFLLQCFMDSQHPMFNQLRDEAIKLLTSTTRKDVLLRCKQQRAYPSQLFGQQ